MNPTGISKNFMSKAYQICKRCIVDTTVPGATFDDQGICSYCHLHNKMEKEYPNDQRGKEYLLKLAEKISKANKHKPFDCIAGISGGRDSTFNIHYLVKILGLRPLAVHFNDGFGNPVAGENMIRVCKKLGVELRTITSDWRESKDLKLAFLKSGTSDLEEATDLGIATALYGSAAKENLTYIFIGQSFRTEGIAPLAWNYLDGKYLKAVHKQFGTTPLRKWTPNDPGFNLDIKEMIYYTLIRRIKTIPTLYYVDYVRKDVDTFLKAELDWQDPGAHYFDDLYQSLLTYVHRVKYGINRRKYNYSALVRSGQLNREEAIEKAAAPYTIEDPKIIDLCIKRLGLCQEDFQKLLETPKKTFMDYPNNYRLIRKARPLIYLMAQSKLLPQSAYDKYFNCGKF